MSNLKYTDLHLHTEYSLQDGAIRVADANDPKHIRSDIIINAERRNTGAVTATDHGSMYGQALLASVAKTFGLKHIPGCEFYLAPEHRTHKSASSRSNAYCHINAWAKNREGYSNLCRMQKLSFTEGFYYVPRIDKELIDAYGDGIIWSDACIGGTLGSLIMDGKENAAYLEFLWYLNRFKDDFYIEYHNHGIEIEDRVNKLKIEWANYHGVPIIACTDAHFNKKEDKIAHNTLLCVQFGKWLDDPTFTGFPGDGYWLMNDEELLERYPKEYLENTQLIVDKVEPGIIQFGDIRPPKYMLPEDFNEKARKSVRLEDGSMVSMMHDGNDIIVMISYDNGRNWQKKEN